MRVALTNNGCLAVELVRYLQRETRKQLITCCTRQGSSMEVVVHKTQRLQQASLRLLHMLFHGLRMLESYQQHLRKLNTETRVRGHMAIWLRSKFRVEELKF